EDPITETDDRLKDTQGLNFFGYVKGNPLKYVDQDGLDWGLPRHGGKDGYRHPEWRDGRIPHDWTPLPTGKPYSSGQSGKTWLLLEGGHYVEIHPDEKEITLEGATTAPGGLNWGQLTESW